MDLIAFFYHLIKSEYALVPLFEPSLIRKLLAMISAMLPRGGADVLIVNVLDAVSSLGPRNDVTPGGALAQEADRSHRPKLSYSAITGSGRRCCSPHCLITHSTLLS